MTRQHIPPFHSGSTRSVGRQILVDSFLDAGFDVADADDKAEYDQIVSTADTVRDHPVKFQASASHRIYVDKRFRSDDLYMAFVLVAFHATRHWAG